MEVIIQAKHVKGLMHLEAGKYGNGTTAIQGFNADWEPEFKATVALDAKPAEGCVFLKGWSENEGIPEALRDAGIVEFTGRKIPTGHVEAIEARLLKEI